MRKLPLARSWIAKLAFAGGVALAGLCAFASGAPAQDRDEAAPPRQQVASTQPAEATAPVSPMSQVAEAANDDSLDKVIAVVDGHPITNYALNQRVALVLATSPLRPDADMMKKLKAQILEQLETEQIERDEAQHKDISISSVAVNKEIKQRFLDDNHITMDQLKAILARGGVDVETFRQQIAAQLVWNEVVEEEYGDRVRVSPAEVNAEMARIAEGQNKVHYLVSEIFFAVDSPEQDGKALKDANGIETQLQEGAPFEALARQFSQSPSAAQGGEIGLVYDGQLAPELNKQLASMKPGDISPPVRSIGGYYILKLNQRLEPAGTKIPEAELHPATPENLPLMRVFLGLPPNPSQKLANQALNVASQIAAHIANCGMAPKVVAQVPGAKAQSLGMMKLSDLSAQMRDAITKTPPGGTAQPFLDAAGVEIITRCDKPVPKVQAFQMPTRDQVEERLFQERISAMARRYLRDLRRTADVETR